MAVRLPGSSGEHVILPTHGLRYDIDAPGQDENHVGVRYANNEQGRAAQKDYVLAAATQNAKAQTEYYAGLIGSTDKLIAAWAVVGTAVTAGVLTGGAVFSVAAEAGGGLAVSSALAGGYEGIVGGSLTAGGLTLLEGGSPDQVFDAAAHGGFYGGAAGTIGGGAFGGVGQLVRGSSQAQLNRALRSGQFEPSLELNSGSALFRREKNVGPFASLEVPMQRRTVKRVARQAGVGPSGSTVEDSARPRARRERLVRYDRQGGDLAIPRCL